MNNLFLFIICALHNAFIIIITMLLLKTHHRLWCWWNGLLYDNFLMNLSEYCWLTNINIFFMIFYQVQKPKVDVPHRVCLPQTSNPLRTVISIVPKNLDIIHIQLTVPNTMFACSVEHYWKVVPVVLCTVTSYVSASTTEWIFHCLFFNFCFWSQTHFRNLWLAQKRWLWIKW